MDNDTFDSFGCFRRIYRFNSNRALQFRDKSNACAIFQCLELINLRSDGLIIA